MPLKLQSESKPYNTEDDCEQTLFASKEDMHRSITRLCYGNLHVIGSLWIEALKSVLVGSKMCLVPSVKAAAKEPKDTWPPKKPPRMKCSELPLYDSQPHVEYKDYKDAEHKCPECNTKMIHNAILPSIKGYRATAARALCETNIMLKDTCNFVCNKIQTKKKELMSITRAPEYKQQRKACVALGAATGFIFGSRKKGYLYRKFFWAGIGSLTTGWLCFPDETDKTFRLVCHETAKILVFVFNLYCGRDVGLKDSGPCSSNMPDMPPERKENAKLCEKKK